MSLLENASKVTAAAALVASIGIAVAAQQAADIDGTAFVGPRLTTMAEEFVDRFLYRGLNADGTAFVGGRDAIDGLAQEPFLRGVMAGQGFMLAGDIHPRLSPYLVKATAAATDTVLLHGLITAFGAALEKQQPNAPTYDPKNPARAGSYFSVRISPIPAVPGIDKLPPKILSEGEVGLSDLSVVFVNEVEYAGLGARSLLDKRWEERTAEIEARNAELRVILRVLTTLAEARNRKLLSAAEVAEKSAKVRGAMNAITREAISLAEKTKPANSAGAPPSRVRMPVMGLPQALIDEAIELEKRLRPLVEKTGPTARLEPAVTLTSGCLDLAIVVMVPPTSPT